MTAGQWYARVRGLAARGGDLEGAFHFVAGECGRVLGQGTTLWLESGGGGDGGPLVHYAAAGGRTAPVDHGLRTELAALLGGRGDAGAQEPRWLPRPRGGGAAVLPLYACAGEMGLLLHLVASAGEEALPVELLLLANVFAAQAANHGYVAELTRAKEWIERELDQVAAIQQALLPEHSGSVRGLTVASSFRAFSHAAGDYFDYVELPPELTGEAVPRWGVMIADAAGHGASAAVEVAMLDAILRTYRGDGRGPAGVFDYANRHLFTRRIRGSFITAFAVNSGPGPGEITYAGAGHNPPLLLRGSGTVEYLDASGGIPLGVMRDFDWHNSRTAVAPGDMILLYTDGVVETGNRAGERFGTARLERAAVDAATAPQALIDGLEQALDAFSAGIRPADDQTMVALRIEP